MAEYIKREDVYGAISGVLFEMSTDVQFALNSVAKEVGKIPSVDVVERDEGIRMGAELAAMHGSDATSQDLEKAFWTGYEEAMMKRDVRPAVHGKWIHTGGKFSRNKTVDRRILTCSICGNTLSMEGVNAGRGDANYCPNCGADMREES